MNPEQIKSKIEDLDAEIRAKQSEIQNSCDVKEKLLREYWEKEEGLKVGAVLRVHDGRSGGSTLYKVTSISFRNLAYYGGVTGYSIMGVTPKKNGDWGKRELCVYGKWEVISDE